MSRGRHFKVFQCFKNQTIQRQSDSTSVFKTEIKKETTTIWHTANSHKNKQKSESSKSPLQIYKLVLITIFCMVTKALTYSSPMLLLFNPENVKKLWFSNVSRGYSNET